MLGFGLSWNVAVFGELINGLRALAYTSLTLSPSHPLLSLGLFYSIRAWLAKCGTLTHTPSSFL